MLLNTSSLFACSHEFSFKIKTKHTSGDTVTLFFQSFKVFRVRPNLLGVILHHVCNSCHSRLTSRIDLPPTWHPQWPTCSSWNILKTSVPSFILFYSLHFIHHHHRVQFLNMLSQGLCIHCSPLFEMPSLHANSIHPPSLSMIYILIGEVFMIPPFPFSKPQNNSTTHKPLLSFLSQ